MNDNLIERNNYNFKYYAPDEDKIKKHENIRKTLKDAANTITTICPNGRELSLALTKLEEAVMWANAAIARGQKLE